MNKTIIFILLLVPIWAVSGGRNDQVKYPEGYRSHFTHYHTQNRANNKQIADMYANDIAINSVKENGLADGSVIVMEIYKPELGTDSKPVLGAEGLFKKAKFAAVAVMEKRSNWPDDYPAEHRAGGWGFALYDTKGMPKENDLECQTCHQSLINTDFMFTFTKLSALH